MEGFFISVEGGDGSGKSTQLLKIKEYLNKKGQAYIFTREPGGTSISEKIRDIILDPANTEMTDLTEALLYAASRAQHIDEVILPALKEGKVVISDRFVDSSLAYQGYARNLGDTVWEINSPAVSKCMPDITFFLDVSPEEAMGRIASRGHDRLEKEEMNFHQKVYDGYQKLIEKDKASGENRIHSIKANRDPEEVWKDIEKILDEHFG